MPGSARRCPTRLLCSPVRWGELSGPGPHCAARAQPAGEGEGAGCCCWPGEEEEGSVCRGEGAAAHSPVLLGTPRGSLSPLSLQKCSSWGRQSRETGCGETAMGLGAVPAPGVPGLVHLLSPRSQSALPVPAVPTPLTAGCPPAAHPCCAQPWFSPRRWAGSRPGAAGGCARPVQ